MRLQNHGHGRIHHGRRRRFPVASYSMNWAFRSRNPARSDSSGGTRDGGRRAGRGGVAGERPGPGWRGPDAIGVGVLPAPGRPHGHMRATTSPAPPPAAGQGGQAHLASRRSKTAKRGWLLAAALLFLEFYVGPGDVLPVRKRPRFPLEFFRAEIGSVRHHQTTRASNQNQTPRPFEIKFK